MTMNAMRIASIFVLSTFFAAAAACAPAEDAPGSDSSNVNAGGRTKAPSADAGSKTTPSANAEAEALLAEAIRLAGEREVNGACESDAFLSTIVDKLEKAVAANGSEEFRARIASHPLLQLQAGRTLGFKAVTGVLKDIGGGRFEGLAAALEARVTFHQPGQGVFGSLARWDFEPDGVLVAHIGTVNEDATDVTWTTNEGTWSVDTSGAGNRVIVNGKSFTLKRVALPQGQPGDYALVEGDEATHESFWATPDECSA
jgi:hypothetical protein